MPTGRLARFLSLGLSLDIRKPSATHRKTEKKRRVVKSKLKFLGASEFPRFDCGYRSTSLSSRHLSFGSLEMASGFGESMSRSPQNPYSNNNSNTEAGNFECNICFDLAQDPIVTLCGHLFCWPCLYKWLHIHSNYRECPVCKAAIQEDKLVPLYGRGKTSTDPRSKSIPGVNIPNRPTGQRPETAPQPEPNHFQQQHGFGSMGGVGGFAPMATARFGNFTLSAAFGGLIPSLFNLQVHGFPDPAMYGPTASFPYGFANSFHGGHPHGFPLHPGQGQQDYYLKRLLLFIGFCVLLALIWQ